MSITNPNDAEILEPVISKAEALNLERRARRHYKVAERNLMQFCVDLRLLQDGGAHFVRGFDNFGAYVEHTFEGLSAASAKQLSRQGHALIVLNDHGRIDVEKGVNLPGTTGLRALASVLNQHGEKVMLDAYDKAAAFRPERKVVAEAVQQALSSMIAKSVEAGKDDRDDEQDEEGVDPGIVAELEDEQPEEVHEVLDRAVNLRGLQNDLSSALAAGDYAEARRVLIELAEEIEQALVAIEALERVS